ncbi:MAG: hypothetical protein JJ992_22375, partial [Planctomycetes bacterium]|nr:hypothetical protein [Planctomycetota bacterium]
RLYGSRFDEAQAWWTLFRLRSSSDSAKETFVRVHRVMSPPPGEDPADFDRLIDQNLRWMETNDSGNRDDLRIGLARTCIQRGRLEWAGKVLEGVDSSTSSALELQADLCWRGEQWEQAADWYARLWEDDHDRLADLYLSGESLQRAGREAEGRQRKDLVHRLAIDSRARFLMARSLLQRGLKDQAAEQFRIVLRTAPPEYWEWNESARYLGEHQMQTDPGEAADWFDFSLLDDLRSYFHLVRDRDYLHTPALIHRLRAAAAIEAGDIEAARRHAQMAIIAAPAETQIGEDLVPLLDAAGERAVADELFQQQFEQHARWCADWPDSALLHNNLAWLAARCGRRLDDSLQHAERAVELQPSASYLDTLAEVHFRLGDRQKAIEFSQRSVALEPDSDTLKSQLHRFQNDPLP